jgi:phage terminase large subunit
LNAPSFSGAFRPRAIQPPEWPDVGLGEDGILRLQTPDVFQPLFEKGPKYKGARGGRGSGKSHNFAEMLIEEAICDPWLRAVCIREIQRTLKQSSKRLIEDKIRKLRVQRYFESTDKEIHILDDDGQRCGVVIFEGMQNHTADSIKSLEGFRIAWVEEAQNLSQRSLDLLYPTIREAGGEIWFSWNPKSPKDPVETFMTGADAQADPNIITVEANYHDNPWFWATELVDDMERDRRRDPDKYAHIWLGAYLKRSEATVFKNWRIAVFETPDVVERFLFGADWGFSVDPSVLVRGFLGRLIERGKDAHGNDVVVAIPDQRGNTLFIDAEAYRVGCEIDYLPALFAGNAPPKHGREWENPYGWRGIPGALRWPITADSARPETISYMKRAGFNIRPAVKGPGSIEDGIEFLRNYDIVVLPTCVHVPIRARTSWHLSPPFRKSTGSLKPWIKSGPDTRKMRLKIQARQLSIGQPRGATPGRKISHLLSFHRAPYSRSIGRGHDAMTTHADESMSRDGDRRTDIFAATLAMNRGDIYVTVADLFSCAGIALALLANNNPETSEADQEVCYRKLAELCRAQYDHVRGIPPETRDVP